MDAIETKPDIELPSLNPGVTLLEAEHRVTGALQSLVLDHLLLTEGKAVWVDANNHATTTSLAKISPSRRVLDRIRVARAFTAFQHYSLIEDLGTAITDETSLIVAPSIEWFYANDDLYRGEDREMLKQTLELLEEVAATHKLPVLLSRHSSGGLGDLVEEYGDTSLNYVQTEFGPRFSGDEFETLVFECANGVQTTLAFWRRVLENRHPAHRTNEHPEVTHVGSY